MGIDKIRIRLQVVDGLYSSKDFVYPDGNPMSVRDSIDYMANRERSRVIDYKPEKPTSEYHHYVGRVRVF